MKDADLKNKEEKIADENDDSALEIEKKIYEERFKNIDLEDTFIIKGEDNE